MIDIVIASPPASLAALVQSALAIPDTVITVSATPTGWKLWADTLTSIASVVIALVLIVGGIAAIPLGLNALKALRTVNSLAAQVRNDVAPLIKHGHAVAENLDYVSSMVRMDAQRLSQTVSRANQRLDHAAELAEKRIHDFNALLEVMQEEAEGFFIGTAAAGHGARATAERLRTFRAEAELYDEDPYEDDDYDA